MNTRQDTIYVIIPDGDFGEPISLSQDTVYDAHVHQFRSTITNILISSRNQGESLETGATSNGGVALSGLARTHCILLG